MGEILQALIVIGIIVFVVVKQLTASSQKEEDKEPQRHPSSGLPKEKPFLAYDHDYSLSNTTTSYPAGSFTETTKPSGTTNSSPPLQESTDDDAPEFDIHSTEEVRRAVIWSEILNRKY